MLKKSWFFLVVFLTGCLQQQEEASMAREHSPFLTVESLSKLPVYWSVQLKDTWNDTSYPIIMNDFGYFRADAYDEAAFRALASEMAAQIDTPMLPAKRDGEGNLIVGKARVILDEAKLVEQLQALEVGATEMDLPIHVTEPNVREEDLIGIDERIIGEFTTSFNPSVKGRAHNIFLSAEAISDVVLGPGDSFSFNQVVGERTKSRGYQEAMEIVNKEFVVGIGGGICQTSSTLYNAVEQADVELIERFSHSRHVGYVAEGRDATVSWGGPDFRFSNPHSYPILIRSNVDLKRGKISVTVFTHEKKN